MTAGSSEDPVPERRGARHGNRRRRLRRGYAVVNWSVETFGPRLALVATGLADLGMLFAMAILDHYLHIGLEKYTPDKVGAWEVKSMQVMSSIATFVTAGVITLSDLWEVFRRAFGRRHDQPTDRTDRDSGEEQDHGGRG